MENTDNEIIIKHPTGHLKPWMWQKGQSGNPAGRPKGKTLKEWTKEWLERMTDEERDAFMEGIPKEIIWKMAEGNPTEDRNIKISTPQPILGGITQAETLENGTLNSCETDTPSYTPDVLRVHTDTVADNTAQLLDIVATEVEREAFDGTSDTSTPPPVPQS